MSQTTPKIIIGDRDLSILNYIYTFRHLTSNHLAGIGVDETDTNNSPILGKNALPIRKYYPGLIQVKRRNAAQPYSKGARNSVGHRITALARTGYIIPIFQGLGRPLIYGLGQAGADVLAQYYGDPAIALERWTEKSQRGSIFMSHTLMVADFMICLILACRQRNDVELIGQDKIIQRRKMAPSIANCPLSWKTKGKGFSYSMVPDWAFGLRITDNKNGKQTEKYYFVEADCAQRMPIKRSGLYGSSIYKKMLGFITSHQGKQISQNFDFSNFRAVFITRSMERMRNMHKLNKRMHPQKNGYSFFKFTCAENYDLARPEAVLQGIWTDGNKGTDCLNNIIH